MSAADDKTNNHSYNFDPIQLAEMWKHILEETAPIYQDFISQFQPPELLSQSVDFEDFSKTLTEFWTGLIQEPDRLYEMQQQYWQDWSKLWQESAERFLNPNSESNDSDYTVGKDITDQHKYDRRFKDPTWQNSIVFDFIKKSYLLTSDWLLDITSEADHLDDKMKQKLTFYMRQYADAMAPTNFPMTNPEVIQKTLESGGQNLIQGFNNLISDLKRGHGRLKISTTKENDFELGKDIATTPGKVMYENELIQLIQYEPGTDKQHKTPLLIIPPFINKFYILDLKEENSFIKYCLDQGHSVFLVSWANPGKDLKDYKFDDYMERGLLKALDQVEHLTGEKQTNVIGYCIGGTLLTLTLSWLQKRSKDTSRIKSATFFTTLIDFRDSGDLNIFIDEDALDKTADSLDNTGYLSAEALHQTFALLRANDLIWSFVVNNYLLGKEPFPFDLLYWNDDPTNLPAALHTQYLRDMYAKNLLAKKDGLTINKEKLDITSFDTPCHFISAKEDHIAPWMATYNGAQKLQNAVFTLAGSGHIAGIVNPPAKNKYGYWVNNLKQDQGSEEWFNTAQHTKGSWWPHWAKWIKQYGDTKVKARRPSDNPKSIIEDAPGSYVKLRAGDIN